jgi:hypothetical protein
MIKNALSWKRPYNAADIKILILYLFLSDQARRVPLKQSEAAAPVEHLPFAPAS